MAGQSINMSSLWLSFSCAAYWAWGLLALCLVFVGDGGAVWGTWTLNAAAHACVSLAGGLLSLRWSWLARTRPILVVASVGAAGGTAAVLLGASLDLTVLSLLGSLMAGACSAPIALLMFPQFAHYTSEEMRLGLVGGSVAASSLVALVVVSLPRLAGEAVLVALPLLAVIGLLMGGAGTSRTFLQAANNGACPREAVSVPLLLCSFVFAFSVTFFSGIDGGPRVAEDRSAFFAMTFLAMLLLLAPMLACDRVRRSPLLVFVFVPVLAAGILLLPFLVGEDRFVSSVLIDTARNLFSVYLYSSLALIVTRKGHGAFVTGLVVGVGDLGHVAAAVWEHVFGLGTNLQVLVACVTIAYVAFICSLLLFYPTRLHQEILGTDLPHGEEPPVSHAAPDPLALAAQSAGLSEREAEVLRLLVGSRTMASIADELGISYNTAKTHTSHIFRKTGVCSREELALWVNRFGQ